MYNAAESIQGNPRVSPNRPTLLGQAQEIADALHQLEIGVSQLRSGLFGSMPEAADNKRSIPETLDQHLTDFSVRIHQIAEEVRNLGQRSGVRDGEPSTGQLRG